MLHKLTNEEIYILASRPYVKNKMVALFLKDVAKYDTASKARDQLNKSAKLCQWNNETINAIEDGIETAII